MLTVQKYLARGLQWNLEYQVLKFVLFIILWLIELKENLLVKCKMWHNIIEVYKNPRQNKRLEHLFENSEAFQEKIGKSEMERNARICHSSQMC